MAHDMLLLQFCQLLFLIRLDMHQDLRNARSVTKNYVLDPMSDGVSRLTEISPFTMTKALQCLYL